MKSFASRSPEASRLRQRKYALVREYGLPEDLLGGCLSHNHRRCGKPNCHCAQGRGHGTWSLTSSHRGKRRVERVPTEWLEEIECAVLESQAFVDAVKEVMAINVELLTQARAQHQQRKVRQRQKKARSGAKTAKK